MLIAVAESSGLGPVASVAGDRPAELLDLVRERPSTHVVLLTPRHAEIAMREQAHVAIAGLPGLRVYVAAFDHHVLTLTLLGNQLAELEGKADGWSEPGEAVQLLRQAAANARSVLWYPRARRSGSTEPTIGQRLASVFGAPGFLAELGVPGLVWARSGLTTRPDEVWCSAGNPPPTLVSQLGTTRCSPVPVTSTGGRPYAARGAVELTGLLWPGRAPLALAPCPSCSAALSTDGCAYCGTGPRARFTTDSTGRRGRVDGRTPPGESDAA